ncbi:conserved hypothetical protein [Desulfamplus magnetovallimortis]|uniref:ATP-grasp domain-containing protein n=1 Tax=Desulfamplus magnetovallimortis TaxID=1246637 RepID=A0A1W1HEZ9_9BACT|nr:ATP-grasp domain-containing protein [Desulfamplus magnetovallimortis]SLM31006.1 conserved hypothetical protein [Desulfamplus magnetovallimortis]
MSNSCKTIVVGTTSDYIDLLRRKLPSKLFFVTSPDIRKKAREAAPEKSEELLCDLSSHDAVNAMIEHHILQYGLTLNGIACFDCESMLLASYVATHFALKYPSPEAILACRDKSLTRRMWHSREIATPESLCITSEEQAKHFFEKNLMPCVLKPLDGSGSERVFRCNTAMECQTAYNTICSFQKKPEVLIEMFVEGTEYSCDVIIEKNCSYPIRFTRKIHAPMPVFGTIMAYELVEFPRGNISQKSFMSMLVKAAHALGISNGICMIDFIVTENGVSLLEMTPRPGGDCLPWLIKKGMNLDILSMNIDVASQPEFHFHAPSGFTSLVGLKIHAHGDGKLKYIDSSRLMEDPRVREVYIKQKPGHLIKLPPEDYDSWNLGHIIFKPSKFISCEAQCMQLLSLLDIEIEEKRR